MMTVEGAKAISAPDIGKKENLRYRSSAKADGKRTETVDWRRPVRGQHSRVGHHELRGPHFVHGQDHHLVVVLRAVPRHLSVRPFLSGLDGVSLSASES